MGWETRERGGRYYYRTLKLGAYYDKRLSTAQRRFTRAVETLERVRMMRRRAGRIGETAGAEKNAPEFSDYFHTKRVIENLRKPQICNLMFGHI